jgi:hypothetical protein
MRPAIQQWAGHYIGNMGFGVVPLVGKKCLVADWPTRTFRTDHFAEGNNIGILIDRAFEDRVSRSQRGSRYGCARYSQ